MRGTQVAKLLNETASVITQQSSTQTGSVYPFTLPRHFQLPTCNATSPSLMAVVLRCPTFLSRPRPQRHFSDHNKPHFTRKFVCLSFKLVPCLKVTCDDASCGVRIPMEHIQQRFPSLMFVATNVLMYSVPSKALAETCEADNSLFNMPILLAVALIGATVGGLLARQRKAELQKVNEQLLQINQALRKQAKIESYAPSLSYAPVGGRIPDNEVIVDPKKQELISKLKNGKNYLRNQQPDKAFTEFKIALELAQNLNDPIEEKKAARGLGASLQRQGKYRDAVKYHSMVLAISEREGEDSGNTEAFGAIADCYTELGDLERAGQFYDKYIARLEKD
ncbi:protein FLUORESCENT IN BLUE LIGHT, chloroplastic [Arachis hypogaea]|nr:protein FLUORESCENT IN BLUE LIGHT, chloroplastic [Arachis hypogaea]QHO33678.1 Protein FLUORESCENT IN BLUE LIGHT [Arachis hypogaea]